ncbi:MAG: hypothetical protein OEZ08_12200 [Betaproteobacteria bacterium]|nr:hypothetical protein [Betaproteobacteria bacterium]
MGTAVKKTISLPADLAREAEALARAEAIVTGDKALLELNEHRSVRSLSLREYLDLGEVSS